MQGQREFDIALSFAGENREYVDQVANLLRDDGVKVFYDLFEEENLWGKNLYEYLSEIYSEKAVYTIMFISHHYAKKMWTNHERQAMQARAFQESQEYILPVRFDETNIPGVLPTVGYISLEKKSPKEFVRIIKKKLINGGLTIPSEHIRRSFFSTVTIPRVEPKTPTISVYSESGAPIEGASVVAVADNSTTVNGNTDTEGNANLTIQTRRKYRLLIAHKEHPGAIIEEWDPEEDIRITIAETENTGSVLMHSTGYIPGLKGRLNPILDTSNRTYLYADNIAIEGGKNQPATFKVGEPFELEDSNGVVMQVRVIAIQGQTSLLQFVQPNYEC